MSKLCPKCHETKPYTEYTRHRGYKDGLNKYCKTCQKSYRKKKKKTHKHPPTSFVEELSLRPTHENKRRAKAYIKAHPEYYEAITRILISLP